MKITGEQSCRVGVLGGTGRRLAVRELASFQQASGSTHDEAWAGRVQSFSLRISQEVDIETACAVTVSYLPPPFFAPASPGTGREVRSWIGWTRLRKTARSGVWWFRGALQGALQGEGVLLVLCAAGDWVKKGSYHTAWSIPHFLLCSCSNLYGKGTATGPQSGELLSGVWRAIALLMKPWCAEEDVPTAANLNLYRGRHSRVGWHSDDEPLFGERGEAKLSVSVSFGTRALNRWKGTSCPDGEASSCWLDHGVL